MLLPADKSDHIRQRNLVHLVINGTWGCKGHAIRHGTHTDGLHW